MKFIYYCTLVTLLLLSISCQQEATTHTDDVPMSKMYENAAAHTAPVATKKPKELSMHGDVRQDPYYWLNERENQEVIDYLNAENTYRESVTAHLKDFQQDLFQEMKGRIKETDESVPYKENGYYYITRYEEGKEYPIYSRKKSNLNQDEEIMLDVNEMAKDYSYYNVSGRTVSPDNRYLAYGEDTLSRRIYTLRVKDLKTGELLPEMIPNNLGFGVWSNDGEYLFYVRKDETLRPYQVWRHKMGTPNDQDVLVWQEDDATYYTYLTKSKSKDYLVIISESTLTSERRILEADNPTGTFRIFQPRTSGLEYGVAHYGDHFYIRTNLDAKNFRLMRTPVDKTGKENWEEVIPHRSDVLLEGMELFKDHMVLSERKAGITNLRVRPWEGAEHYIEFPDQAYLAYTTTNPEYDTDVVRIGYTSLTTPNSTYDYNMKTRDMKLLKQQEVVGGQFDPNNYQSERVMVKARDGAEVPVSIVYRKDRFAKDGTHPILLYGYGSYGNSMDPYFSSVRLSLLDRGFGYAIAHIRGGEEMGRQWYEDGKLLKKKNTFNDFVDVGRWLVSSDYAADNQLYAMGGSAGGLLMGAVINQAPELWAGMIAAVPFVDVVTTMLDESIPLTTGEFDEWGNPKNEEYYHYIKSYSPYDNIEAKDYPPMLVTTGLHDSQVQYWEPAKWVARLRDTKTDTNPLLLYTNMDTGHGGASGRFERLKEVAMEYAFLIDLAGAPHTIAE